MCRKNNIKAIISIIFVISLIFILIVPKKVNANTVEYTGDETGVVTTLGDFFASFGELMPGDVKEGKALIKNKTKEIIKDNIHGKFADYVKIRSDVREEVGNYLYKLTESRPVILTVIQEL